MPIELWEHQDEASKSGIKFAKQSKGGSGIIILPTGSGKSYVMASIIKKLNKVFQKKVVLLSHVAEIIEQDEKSIRNYSDIDVGVYSSMMNRKEIKDVTVAGIQSIYKRADLFEKGVVVIVDECDMIPQIEKSRYQTLLKALDYSVLIGLTATPFRLECGYIYGKNKMFETVICDWSTPEKYNLLIERKILSPLDARGTDLQMDLSDIKLIGGDYNEKQMSDKFDRLPVTNAATAEIIAKGKNRKKWLIFAIDIDHAEHIAEVLNMNGIRTGIVHSRMHEYGFNRKKVIEQYRNGDLHCLVNVNILTVGFDVPDIDMLCILRPTQSPRLHVQILGRGGRSAKGKTDCLVLDFAGNITRLGPINDPVVREPGKGTGGEMPCKECPGNDGKCKLLVPISTRECPDCGHKFPFKHNLSASSIKSEVLASKRPVWIDVDGVEYEPMRKVGKPSNVCVIYDCSGFKVREYINVEHSGYAKHKSDHWVDYRGGTPCRTVDDLMNQRDILKVPRAILVSKKGKYYIVSDSKF
jgi:DNA repair protein RadD